MTSNIGFKSLPSLGWIQEGKSYIKHCGIKIIFEHCRYGRTFRVKWFIQISITASKRAGGAKGFNFGIAELCFRFIYIELSDLIKQTFFQFDLILFV